MPQSMTNFDNALKDFYGPGLKESVNNSNVILTEATRNEEDFVGRRAVWSVHTSRSASTGARAELGTLPTADRQRYSQPNEDLAYLYHTIKVSGVAKALTRSDAGSFTRALESELDGAEKDLKNDLARQCFGQKKAISSTYYSGVLGLVNGDPGTGTTITVDNGAGVPFGTRQLFVGEKISFLDPATGTARTEPSGGYEVASVTSSTVFEITTAADGTIADNDWIVRYGNFGNEINGLRHLVSTEPFAGIDPATVPAWGAKSYGTAGTTQISETVLDQAAELVETEGDGSRPMLFIGEHSQRAKLAQQLQAQKMYEGRQKTLTAGWIGLDVAQGTFVVDRYCPVQNVFGLTTKYLVHFVGLDWSWDDDDGKVLYKALDGSDAVEARFKTYMNLVVTVRNAHVKINLATPSL